MNTNTYTHIDDALAKIAPHLPLESDGSAKLCVIIATASTSNAIPGRTTHVDLFDIVVDDVIAERSASLDKLLVKAINACDLYVECMRKDFDRADEHFTPADLQQFADCSPNICQNN